MRLFLSGGGSGEQSTELDKKFASVVGKTKPLLYIPIAIDKTKHPYPECLKWLSRTFKPLGLERIELWTEEDLRKKPETELTKFGGIYIGGGNTFYLLKELKQSEFLPKLERFIRQGFPVYGGSAGAIICGKTILTSHDENFVGIRDFGAMNLVRNQDIFCHYNPEMKEEIQKYSQKYGLKVIALPENCGLYVTDKNIEVVGPGSARVTNGKIKTIKPGKAI